MICLGLWGVSEPVTQFRRKSGVESLPGRGPVTTSTDTLTVRPQLQCVLDPVVDKQKRTMAGEQKVLSGLFKKKEKKRKNMTHKRKVFSWNRMYWSWKPITITIIILTKCYHCPYAALVIVKARPCFWILLWKHNGGIGWYTSMLAATHCIP